jgi:hypothetical protein
MLSDFCPKLVFVITTNYMTNANIVPRSLWIAPLAALALFGAGCFQPEPVSVTPPVAITPAVPVVVPAPTPAPTPVPTPTPTTVPTTGAPVVLPSIDDTWKVYTNKGETFSFQWPTKGRMAPTWEVLMPKTLTDGCYINAELGENFEKSTLTAGGLTFCHTSVQGAATSHRYLTDYYATVVDGQNVVISFEKVLVVGDVIGDGKCTGVLVLPSSTENPCLVVDPTAYASHLDQIVGTFKKLK